MTRDEVKEKVFNLILKQFKMSDVENLDTKDFIADLKADSLDTLQLTMEIEETFHIKVSDEEAEALMTPDRVVDFVFKKLSS